MRLSAIFITAITAALAAGLAYGQNPPASPKPDAITQPFEAEIIHVSTLTGDSFDRLVKLLAVFDARVQADQQLRTTLLRKCGAWWLNWTRRAARRRSAGTLR